jgi:hypothetical protein
LAIAFVAGRKRVPRPATGKTALRSDLIIESSYCWNQPSPDLGWA